MRGDQEKLDQTYGYRETIRRGCCNVGFVDSSRAAGIIVHLTRLVRYRMKAVRSRTRHRRMGNDTDKAPMAMARDRTYPKSST